MDMNPWFGKTGTQRLVKWVRKGEKAGEILERMKEGDRFEITLVQVEEWARVERVEVGVYACLEDGEDNAAK